MSEGRCPFRGSVLSPTYNTSYQEDFENWKAISTILVVMMASPTLSILIFIIWQLRIDESLIFCPEINRVRVPEGPSPIIYQEWTDTRTISYLQYTSTKQKFVRKVICIFLLYMLTHSTVSILIFIIWPLLGSTEEFIKANYHGYI